MKAFNGAVLGFWALCLGLSLPAYGAADEAQAALIEGTMQRLCGPGGFGRRLGMRMPKPT